MFSSLSLRSLPISMQTKNLFQLNAKIFESKLFVYVHLLSTYCKSSNQSIKSLLFCSYWELFSHSCLKKKSFSSNKKKALYVFNSRCPELSGRRKGSKVKVSFGSRINHIISNVVTTQSVLANKDTTSGVGSETAS